jgi:hypothetical protein
MFRAGKYLTRLPELAKRFGQAGVGGGTGRDILMMAAPGAVLSGGITTLTTGDPLAGLATGGADLLGSALIARGLGSRALHKRLPKGWNLGGSMENVTPKVGPRAGQTTSRFSPSLAQNIGMWGTTFGAPSIIEPMFLGNQQATQIQQLAQRRAVNGLQTGPMSGNSMFQLAGVPVRYPGQYADDFIRGVT